MENACTDCYGLVLHNKPHSALKKISELKGSELYKCCNCYAYLHKHDSEWEIISGGDVMGSPEGNRKEQTIENSQITSSGHVSYQL